MIPNSMGELAAALAKAQSTFPPIPRDKTVTVRTTSGGSYTFAYAPLETILAAVREPLANNGLAFVQAIDDNALVTILMHKSGAQIEGRTRLANEYPDLQKFGSALTYLRRYAITAMLGIATEEDDDGNAATGNTVTTKPEKAPEPVLVPLGEQTHTGRVAKGDGENNDLEFHADPNGYRFGFKLVIGDGQSIPQVICTGPIGTALLGGGIELLGQTVTVTGEAFRVEAQGRRPYRRLMVESIEGPGFKVPAGPIEPSTDKVDDLDKLPF